MNNLITEEMILLNIDAKNKEEVIDRLSKLIEKQGRLLDFNGFIKQVYAREEDIPTSIGFDFAIPHGKCDFVKTPALAFARLENKVKWSEEENAKYIFLIAVPEKEAGGYHLKILAQLSRKIMKNEFREKLETAKNAQEILKILDI